MNISNNKSASCAESDGEGGVSSNKKVCTSYDQKFENCNDGASNSLEGGSNMMIFYKRRSIVL